MLILEDLWYGNIELAEKSFRRDSRYYTALKEISDLEKDLLDIIPDDSRTLLQKYDDAQRNYSCLTEYEAFVQGFRLGAKVILDIYDDDSSLPSRSR